MVVLNETLRTSTPSPAEVYRDRMMALNREKPSLLSRYSNLGPEDDLNFIDAQDMEADGIKVKCTCRETEKGRFVTEFSADEQFMVTTPETSVPTTTEGSTTTANPAARLRHEELVEENFEVGVMFASKPVVQAIINPFVGAATNRYPSFLVLLSFLTFFLFFPSSSSILRSIKDSSLLSVFLLLFHQAFPTYIRSSLLLFLHSSLSLGISYLSYSLHFL